MGDHVPREMTVRVNQSPDRTRLTDQWFGTSRPSRSRGGLLFSRQSRNRYRHQATNGAILLAFPMCSPLYSSLLVHPMRLAVRVASVLALSIPFGCTSTPTPRPSPDLPPSRTDTLVTAPPLRAGEMSTVTFSYREGSYGYDLEQITIVAVGADARMEDTLVTSGSLTYTIRRSNDTLVVDGIVDSLSVTSTRDTLAAPRRLASPVTIGLQPSPDPAPVVLDSTLTPPGCDSMEDAARAIARDLHIRIPSGAQRGHRWTDSTAIPLCRGGIPMIATSVSSCEVRGVQSRGDSAIAQIVRRSTLTLTGAGVQGSRRIAVAGTGTSEAVFTYDLRGGAAFVESTGQSLLQLRFETTQQTETVTQRATSRARLRPRAPF